ncbi:thiamine pyrophosphate-binding protein [Glutamicibacter arilaitensis]|uniref:thiamine pyrophosphate-binding protein n=1 Tax=Glutamicibacter arilaitensis TaxID=256701 RepID=UPI00385048C8
MKSLRESAPVATQQQTVSEIIAAIVPEYTTEVFTVMGNGNAYFLDALTLQGNVRLTALRHEAGTVASADSYYRISRKIACASTTYGPGFTNALTPLGEAVCSRTPMVVVAGSQPRTGPRPWDVNQTALTEAMGAVSMTVDARNPAGSIRAAFETAVAKRLPVVLNLPYDVATATVTDADSAADPSDAATYETPSAPCASTTQVQWIVDLLKESQRPLILAGRGARYAAEDLGSLADKIGALTVSSAPARGTFAGREWDLGVCGGFASDASSELIKQADVVLSVGVSLNQFTTAFGFQFAKDAKIIQIDLNEQPTNPLVTTFVSADASETVRAILGTLPSKPAPSTPWGGVAEHARDSTINFQRDSGSGTALDGRLDPRTAMIRLNEILPKNRQVISDGGHFIGWSSYYFDLPTPDSLVMVGTQYQSIGLGLPSAAGAAIARPDRTHVVVAGDGGAIMGLADLDALVRTSRSAAVLIFNDGCYGAEVHQYGSQGLDTGIMEIEQADFAKLAEGFGATGAVIHTMEDLDLVDQWVKAGAKGTFVIDLRISRNVVAPYIEEIVELTLKK